MARKPVGEHELVVHQPANVTYPGLLAPGDAAAQPAAAVTADDHVAGELQEDSGTIEIDDEISRIITELGDTQGIAKVQVWRVKPETRKLVFVDELQPQDYSMKRIADDYGGGLYNIKVYVPKYDEDGTQRGVKLVANPRIEIDGPPKPPKRDEPPAPVVAPADALARTLQDGLLKLGELIVASRPQQSNMTELLNGLAALDNLRGKNAAPAVSPDPFAMLDRVMSVAEKIRDATTPIDTSNESATTFHLVKEFLPMIQQAMNKPPAPAPALSAPVAPVVTPTPAPQADQQTAQGEADMFNLDPMKLVYTGYVKMLLSKARAGAPVDPVAEEVYDRADEDLLSWLIHDERYLDRLAEFDSDARMFADWFGKLRAAILKLHAEDQESTS